MTRNEAAALIHAKAVEIWSRESFRGSRSDAQRAAELALGFTADLFQDELASAISAANEFRPFEGELFA